MKEKLKWIIPLILVIAVIVATVVFCFSNQKTNNNNEIGQKGQNNEIEQTANNDKEQENETNLNNLETSNTGKTLIIYYSLTNRTERVAETLKEKTGGDLYRIETVRTYPDEVMEVSAEARKERETKNYPELKGTLPNIDDYDFIIVGGPVWGSTTSTPLKSFLEQVDFKGKKVAPYWTDDGMPGHVESDFSNEAQNAEVLDGMGLTDVKDMSDEDIANEIDTWLNKLLC